MLVEIIIVKILATDFFFVTFEVVLIAGTKQFEKKVRLAGL